ncbi:MAG: glycerol kinase, partial [Victivallales bacterium]|nr:glycerol kinase [Victivallales bacterium]
LSNGKAHVTDYTNASRTMLFNIRTLDWDDKLLQRLGIPRCMLPKVVPSSGLVATCDHPAFGHAPIPITGIAGDQQSALAGQYCDQYGDMKITYGTGAFLLLNTGDRFIESRNGLLTTLGAGTRRGKPEYVLEGSVFMAGAIMQWLRDGLGILPDTSKTAEIATSVKDTGGVCLVPAFTGLGAPHWNAQARASLTGMTRATTYREIIRAADEAIAFQCADLIKAMEQDMQAAAGSIRVDGGAARDEFLLQFQADMLNHDIERPDYVESTALGAVRLAMLATGLAAKRGEGSKIFKPSMSETERAEHLARWKKALKGVLDAAE